jgi:hypothetical protein
MDSSDFVTDENSVVIVSLNISETNETINGTKGKAFMKSIYFFLRIKMTKMLFLL